MDIVDGYILKDGIYLKIDISKDAAFPPDCPAGVPARGVRQIPHAHDS